MPYRLHVIKVLSHCLVGHCCNGYLDAARSVCLSVCLSVCWSQPWPELCKNGGRCGVSQRNHVLHRVQCIWVSRGRHSWTVNINATGNVGCCYHYCSNFLSLLWCSDPLPLPLPLPLPPPLPPPLPLPLLPFHGRFSTTSCVSRHKKGRIIPGFNEARDDGVSVASAGPYADHLHLAPDR